MRGAGVYNTYKIETHGGEPAPRGRILSKGLLTFSVFTGREKPDFDQMFLNCQKDYKDQDGFQIE